KLSFFSIFSKYDFTPNSGLEITKYLLFTT
ncbi:MAG: hypothetical protein ACI97N_001799, partial [Cognaticolwellia sp.]